MPYNFLDDRLYPQRFDLHPQVTTTVKGNTTTTISVLPLVADFPCSVQSMMGRMGEQHGVETSETKVRVSMKQNIGARPGDHLKGKGLDVGRTLRVLVYRHSRSEDFVGWIADCEEEV
jgi:hypothetical protein